MVTPGANPRYGIVGIPPIDTDQFNPEAIVEEQEQYCFTPKIKCVLVGDGAIGKTSLIVSYTTNGYPNEYVPTAFDNYAVVVTVDNRPVRLQLCDTAGQDDFDSLRPLCYPGTDVFLVCFSVVSPTSFNNVAEKWLPELQMHSPKVPIVLIGTQCDLRNDVKVLIELAQYNEEPVSETATKALASRIHAEYIECSALTQKNLKEVFDCAILMGGKYKGLIDSDKSQEITNKGNPWKRRKKTKSKEDPINNSTKPCKRWKKICCLS